MRRCESRNDKIRIMKEGRLEVNDIRSDLTIFKISFKIPSIAILKTSKYVFFHILKPLY